jgi:hypothetical protein
VPPDFFYWDGKIIKAADGTYHKFMSTWADSLGFNLGWTSSERRGALVARARSEGRAGPVISPWPLSVPLPDCKASGAATGWRRRVI